MSELPFETITINSQLELTQFTPDDAARLFELTNNNREYLERFLPWVPAVGTVDDSLAHINETIANRLLGKAFTYGIKYRDEFVGNISIMHIDEPDKTEIGYWIDEAHSGLGITTLAVEALTNLGLSVLGLTKLHIRASPDNIGSNKVAEKAGYVFEGLIQDHTHGALNVWSMST